MIKIFFSFCIQAASKKRRKTDHIPYRDSVLTWLLRENLGGNSRTAMIAAISPADVNYDETLSTLRYADRAKQILCKAIVNEDANAKIIRELKEEIAKLKYLLKSEGIDVISGEISNVNVDQVKSRTGSVSAAGENAIEQLQESEKLMCELNETWEEKLKRTEIIRLKREAVLSEIGVATREDGDAVGIFLTPHETPHLVNLNEDPLMSECLIYYLKNGYTRVGRSDAQISQDIQLNGSEIHSEHCIFHNNSSIVTLIPKNGASCFVNGMSIDTPTQVKTGARVILGKYHVFRFQNPKEAREIREKKSPSGEPGNPVDWTFAQLELLEKQGIDLKEEMQQKLLAIEEEYRRKKEESENVFEEQRKVYEARIESLERQVNEQSMTISTFSTCTSTLATSRSYQELTFLPEMSCEEKKIVRRAVKLWKKHRFTSLRDDLCGMAVFLKLANSMSVELRKRVQFQFILLTHTIYSPISAELQAVYTDEERQSTSTSPTHCSSPTPPTSFCALASHFDRTIVAVQVLDTKSGAVHIWSLNELRFVGFSLHHHTSCTFIFMSMCVCVFVCLCTWSLHRMHHQLVFVRTPMSSLFFSSYITFFTTHCPQEAIILVFNSHRILDSSCYPFCLLQRLLYFLFFFFFFLSLLFVTTFTHADQTSCRCLSLFVSLDCVSEHRLQRLCQA